MILRLFDVSQYLHAGERQSNMITLGAKLVQGVYRSIQVPSGGLSVLLNTIQEFKNDDTVLVYCLDSPPTYKRELHASAFPNGGGYKGQRGSKTAEFKIQESMVEEMLRQIGVNVIRVEGYEADDIISSLVSYYKDDFDKVYVHSRDSDSFYLVGGNVEVVPVNGRGLHVTQSNYELIVPSKKGAEYMVPYNTITIGKLVYGESGDNIPYIEKSIADKFTSSLNKKMFPAFGNNKLLRQLLKDSCNNDPRTMAICDLVMPVILPYEDVELYEEEFNKDMYQFYGIVTGNKYFRRYTEASSTLGEATIMKYYDEYRR